jgi:hypothetical protein
MGMQLNRLSWALAVLVAGALAASDVYAQMNGMGGRAGRNRGADSQGSTQDTRTAQPAGPPDPNSYGQIDYRLTLLRDDLKLKPEQMDAWQSFAGKVRSLADDIARERERNLTASTNTVPTSGLQYIGQTLDTVRNRYTVLEDLESSAKALYLILAPEQKALADTRIPTIVAPRAAAAGASVMGGTQDPAAGSRPPR